MLSGHPLVCKPSPRPCHEQDRTHNVSTVWVLGIQDVLRCPPPRQEVIAAPIWHAIVPMPTILFSAFPCRHRPAGKHERLDDFEGSCLPLQRQQMRPEACGAPERAGQELCLLGVRETVNRGGWTIYSHRKM